MRISNRACGQPDGVTAAVVRTVGPRPGFLGVEADLPQAVGESSVRPRRPNRQHPSRPQRVKGRIQAGEGVEPVILAPSQPLRAVVHVEQDSVKPGPHPLEDESHIGDSNPRARILERLARQSAEVLGIPLHHCRHPFGHHHFGDDRKLLEEG
jgi:hypothetical protein